MVLLFLAAFVWAFFSFGNFWSSKNITVPDVVGKSAAVAETELKEENLRVSVDEIASDTVPAGRVISQTPQAGASVKEQRIIHLTVSKGGVVIQIPDLKGMTLDQAQEQLKRLHLKLGAVETGSDSSMPLEVIISQTPAPGMPAEKGTTVNVQINGHQAQVPNVVGMTLSEAQKTLSALQLSVGNITANDSSLKADNPDNIVVAQTPSAGILLRVPGWIWSLAKERIRTEKPVWKNGERSTFPFPKAERPVMWKSSSWMMKVVIPFTAVKQNLDRSFQRMFPEKEMYVYRSWWIIPLFRIGNCNEGKDHQKPEWIFFHLW